MENCGSFTLLGWVCTLSALAYSIISLWKALDVVGLGFCENLRKNLLALYLIICNLAVIMWVIYAPLGAWVLFN